MEMAGKQSVHYFRRWQPKVVTTINFFLEKNEKNEKCLELPYLARKLIRKIFSLSFLSLPITLLLSCSCLFLATTLLLGGCLLSHQTEWVGRLLAVITHIGIYLLASAPLQASPLLCHDTSHHHRRPVVFVLQFDAHLPLKVDNIRSQHAVR